MLMVQSGNFIFSASFVAGHKLDPTATDALWTLYLNLNSPRRLTKRVIDRILHHGAVELCKMTKDRGFLDHQGAILKIRDENNEDTNDEQDEDEPEMQPVKYRRLTEEDDYYEKGKEPPYTNIQSMPVFNRAVVTSSRTSKVEKVALDFLHEETRHEAYK